MPETTPPHESIETLRESREWLRVTLASIGDGVITTDHKGRVTMLNGVAQSLTGWTGEEGGGRELTEVFHIVNQETRAKVDNPALRALDEGVIVGLANHTILIARDGTERNIDDSAAPIRNHKGEVAGAVLVFRDITERYRQEQLIKAERDYSFNILETQRDPFLVLDSDLKVVSANRAFYGSFKVDREGTEGVLFFDLGNGEWDIPQLRELLEGILPQNSHFDDFEVTHDFASLGERVMVLNARRIVKPGNHSNLILLAIEDVTERARAERAYRDSEVRYRRLFESAKDGILILDGNTGKITDANPYIAKLIGVDAAALIGKELWEIGLFRDIEESKQTFQRLKRDGYVQYDHLPLRNHRGEQVDVEFVSNMYHEDHHLVAQCNVRSIAERHLREQARILADENRRKDEFLAMLSHELRNPLAPIRSAVYLLRSREGEGDMDAVQKHAHEIIERQVANMTRLISDLLEVSRAISGRIRVELHTLDLRQVVEHSVEATEGLIDQRKHGLEVSLPPNPVWVNIDATRMEEVIVNILTNAAKYTRDDGNGRLRVTLETTSDHLAVLRIADNGDGIDKELLPRIFDLFSQGNRSLDRSQGGLGIGLALAHRLVHLMGGSIAATSEGPRRGSQFIVKLPLAQFEPPSQEPEVIESETTDATDLEAHRRPRVLVVDDNVDLVTMFAYWLQEKGYAVEAAYDGLSALKVAREWQPEFVLLDIGLPKLDGYEVARQIRSAQETAVREARLIALSGYGRDVDKESAREAGFDAHLAKPVDMQDLEKVMTGLKSKADEPDRGP